jgi:hypothetical protein
MSEAVQELLKSFDRLPESERREAFSEILKRANDIDALSPGRNASSSLSEEDEELVHLAELTFLELDAREAADGNS